MVAGMIEVIPSSQTPLPRFSPNATCPCRAPRTDQGASMAKARARLRSAKHEPHERRGLARRYMGRDPSLPTMRVLAR